MGICLFLLDLPLVVVVAVVRRRLTRTPTVAIKRRKIGLTLNGVSADPADLAQGTHPADEVG